MAQYNGFSTINVCLPKTTNGIPGSAGGPGGVRQGIVFGKKFRLTDFDLVIQDFINALNIRKGSKVGQPNYGTIIWDYIFEYNASDTQFGIENEIRRVAAQDPRIILNYVKAYPYDNGILLEVEIAVNPFNQATVLNIGFNTGTNTATLI